MFTYDSLALDRDNTITIMTYPNFFILGAAKSGTTTLYYYLKEHPDVFLSNEKEPNFYSTDFQIIDNETDYQALYQQRTTETIVGEASHAYLSNPLSASILKSAHPNAKFVVILRNPAERAYSLYNHMLRHGYETVNNFEKALLLEDSRLNSVDFKDSCNENIWNFAYFKSGLFGEQVERYFSLFDKEQFHFITLKELAKSPKKTLSGVYDFLQLTQFDSPALLHKNNSNKIPTLPTLRNFIQKKSNRQKQPLVFRAINILNSKQVPRLKAETRNELMHQYASDLEKLYSLTGIRF